MIDLLFFFGGIGLLFLSKYFCLKSNAEDITIDDLIFENGLVSNIDDINNENNRNNIGEIPPRYSEDAILPSYDEIIENNTSCENINNEI